MTALAIQTVKEYNEKQTSMCMVFTTANGEPKKRGFVVTFNGDNKFAKTLKEAEQITAKDFERNIPKYWNEAGMSNVEYINQ